MVNNSLNMGKEFSAFSKVFVLKNYCHEKSYCKISRVAILIDVVMVSVSIWHWNLHIIDCYHKIFVWLNCSTLWKVTLHNASRLTANPTMWSVWWKQDVLDSRLVSTFALLQFIHFIASGAGPGISKRGNNPKGLIRPKSSQNEENWSERGRGASKICP